MENKQKEHLGKVIKGCIDRNERSRRMLYDLFSEKMFSVCLRYARSKQHAEDIFQDAFLKVFENIHQVRDVSALPGWIKMIFVNTAITSYKHELKINTKDLQGIGEKMFLDQDVLSELSHKELKELIGSLPHSRKVIFNLHVIEGYTHEEISGMMGISVGTSKSQLHEAKQTLKGWIVKRGRTELRIVS